MIWAYPSTDRKKDILRTFLIFSPKACQGYHPPFAAGKMPPKIVLSPSANHTDRNQAWYRNTHPNLSPGPSNPRLTSPTFGLLFSPCFWALPYHLDRGLFSSPASPHQHVKTFIGRRQKLPSSHIPSSYSPFLLLILVRHFESTPCLLTSRSLLCRQCPDFCTHQSLKLLSAKGPSTLLSNPENSFLSYLHFSISNNANRSIMGLGFHDEMPSLFASSFSCSFSGSIFSACPLNADLQSHNLSPLPASFHSSLSG